MPSYFHPYCSSVPDVTRSIMLKPLTVFIYSYKSCTTKSRQTKRHLYSKNRIKYKADFGEVPKGPRLPSTYYLSKSRPKSVEKNFETAPPPPITRFAVSGPPSAPSAVHFAVQLPIKVTHLCTKTIRQICQHIAG